MHFYVRKRNSFGIHFHWEKSKRRMILDFVLLFFVENNAFRFFMEIFIASESEEIRMAKCFALA